MKKIAVIYSTLTGNTKEVAEAIHSALPESKIFSVADSLQADLTDYHDIFVGFWVDKGTADLAATELIKSLKGKRVALFGTVGAPPNMVVADGMDYGTKCLNNVKELFDQSCKIVSSFICQGRIAAKMTEAFKHFPVGHPHYLTPERLARHEASQVHPDVQDKDMAKIFALQAAKLFDRGGADE